VLEKAARSAARYGGTPHPRPELRTFRRLIRIRVWVRQQRNDAPKSANVISVRITAFDFPLRPRAVVVPDVRVADEVLQDETLVGYDRSPIRQYAMTSLSGGTLFGSSKPSP